MTLDAACRQGIPSYGAEQENSNEGCRNQKRVARIQADLFDGTERDICRASMMEIDGAMWKRQADGMPCLESLDVILGSITV